MSVEEFGPVMRGRGRGKAPARGALRVVAVSAVTLALVAVIGGIGLGGYLSGKMRRVSVGGLDGNPLDELNVLVVGSDSREGFTPQQLQALGTDAVAGRRTDTILLLSISHGRAAMLAFPRDLFVTRCDGTRGRINGAYATGGPTCLAKTVGRLTGIGIDDYIEVNLLGFSRIVDAAGGVPIYLDEPLVDRAAGANLPAGWVVLDGRTALGYVRARNVDASGDLGRIARQQRFLEALGHKVGSPNALANVPRLFRLATAAGSSVTADRGLGPIDLVRAARGARSLAGGGLAAYTVPTHPRTIGGADVLVPDKDAAEALFAQFRDGSILRRT
ncbi:MAG: LCP family protein [Egibacteraceae bacterium]